MPVSSSIRAPALRSVAKAHSDLRQQLQTLLVDVLHIGSAKQTQARAQSPRGSIGFGAHAVSRPSSSTTNSAAHQGVNLLHAVVGVFGAGVGADLIGPALRTGSPAH